MQTKLTLRIDEELIARAQAYADRSGRSVSSIVADFFALLDAPLAPADELTPTVRDLYGVLSDTDVDEEDYGHIWFSSTDPAIGACHCRPYPRHLRSLARGSLADTPIHFFHSRL